MLEQGNKRPTYQIPDEYKQNLALAQNMAKIGLPQQQYNNQVNAILGNQAGAVSALGNSANPGAGLASIVRGGNAAFGNLNAQDAAARQANQRYAIAQNSALGNQKLQEQQYNQFDKYSENFNRAQALRGSSSQDLQNGINGAAQIGAGIAMNGNYGFGKEKKPPLDENFTSQNQIPKSMWNNFGTGQSGNLGFDMTNPSYQKYNYNPYD